MLMIYQAEALTGIKNPIIAGQELLKKGVRTKWVIVKMGSRGSILITMSSISCAPAFKVLFTIQTHSLVMFHKFLLNLFDATMLMTVVERCVCAP